MLSSSRCCSPNLDSRQAPPAFRGFSPLINAKILRFNSWIYFRFILDNLSRHSVSMQLFFKFMTLIAVQLWWFNNALTPNSPNRLSSRLSSPLTSMVHLYKWSNNGLVNMIPPLWFVTWLFIVCMPTAKYFPSLFSTMGPPFIPGCDIIS